MAKSKSRFVETLEENRSSLLELVLVAVLISLAVNILAAILSSRASRMSSIAVSVGLLVVAFAYLFVARVGSLSGSFGYEGFLLYDSRNKRLLTVPGYSLCEDAQEYLDAAVAEDEAVNILWNRDALDAQGVFDSLMRRKRAIPASVTLVRELLE